MELSGLMGQYEENKDGRKEGRKRRMEREGKKNRK